MIDCAPVIAKVLAAPDLPSPSSAVLQLVRLTQDEHVDMRRLEQAASCDPSFVARLLKVANMIRTGDGRRPIVAVKDALLVLGLPALRGMAVAFSILDQHQNGKCKGFDYRYFWSHSLLLGLCFQRIASALKAAPPDEGFTVGLLTNIGSLALATVFPAQYSDFIQAHKQASYHSIEEVEISTFGVAHGGISAELMRQWGMPKPYILAVAAHECPQQDKMMIDSREYRLSAGLALSEIICDLLLDKRQRTSEKIHQFYRRCARVSLEREDVIEIGQEIALQFEHWAAFLGVESGRSMTFDWMEESPSDDAAHLTMPLPLIETHGCRVMVVEDESSVRAYLTELLSEAGYQVDAFASAEEAWASALAVPVDIVLTDWILPGKSGIDLLRQLRAQPWGTRIYALVLTVQTDERHLIEAFEAGANDFVTKPIKPNVLRSRLRAGANTIRLQREFERQYAEIKDLALELSESNKKLRELSITDALTGCPNRRYAVDRLRQEWAATERHGGHLSCLLIDVDRFKSVNDLFGHERGDEVLCLIAKTIREGVRTEDVVCRVGGDEFWVICPGADHEAAVICAERLCQSVSELKILAGTDHCTLSIGVAQKTEVVTSPQALIDLADKRLYASKHAGRDRVTGEARDARRLR